MSTPTGRERPAEAPEGARGKAKKNDPRNVWRDAVWSSTLSATDKLVAFAYGAHAGKGLRGVWVAPELLRSMTSLGKTAINGSLRRLEAAGWLVVVERARQHRSTRYALTVPATPSGAPGEPLTDSQQTARRTAETSSGSPRGSSGSPRGSSSSRGAPEPPSYPLTNPQPPTVPDIEDDLARVRAEKVGGLVDELRSHKHGAGLTAAALEAHAVELREAGWTPADLTTALAAQDFTGARSPAAVFRFRLKELATSGPPRATIATAAPDEPRCADHGTRGAASCSPCWSEVKTGDRHPEDVGRVPQLPAPADLAAVPA